MDISLIKNIRLYLFDMDGTLYLGNRLYDFTIELLQEIRRTGGKYLFITNNSSKSVADYVKKLAGFGIEATRPAHDALGDAYHTELICARLDLKKGAVQYDEALKSHENGFHGAELPGCISRKVFYDYSDKRTALSAMAGEENICPICGARMLGSRWFAQPGHRYMDLATCPEHGKFLIRVRLSVQPDERIRVSRLTYEATSEAAEAYARRAEKADPEDSGRRRRRRSRKTTAPETTTET